MKITFAILTLSLALSQTSLATEVTNPMHETLKKNFQSAKESVSLNDISQIADDIQSGIVCQIAEKYYKKGTVHLYLKNAPVRYAHELNRGPLLESFPTTNEFRVQVVIPRYDGDRAVMFSGAGSVNYEGHWIGSKMTSTDKEIVQENPGNGSMWPGYTLRLRKNKGMLAFSLSAQNLLYYGYCYPR